MLNERSTHHFYMLDLLHKEKGWQEMPGWDGPSLSYAVGVAQRGRFYLFSGRSYAPDEAMVEYTEGYVFEPNTKKWNKMTGSFPVMAGTALPYGEDKILLLGEWKRFCLHLPDIRDSAVNCGWSVRIRILWSIRSTALSCPCYYKCCFYWKPSVCSKR